MSIFGQVWLWSLLSFVAGVLLTWLVLVRPARKQIFALEDQLAEAAARPVPARAPVVEDFEVDEWDSAPQPSLADEVLASTPRVDELSGTSYEDDRPRSLQERLSPEADRFQQSGLDADDFDDEPEPTRFVPSYVAAPAEPEPTAPPEIDEAVDDFIYQPREVWQDQEAFADEAAEEEDDVPAPAEQTSLIPLPAGAEDQWPETDLTGEYAGLQDQIANRLSGEPTDQTDFMRPVEEGFTEPESPAEQTLIQRPISAEDGGWRPGAAYRPSTDDRSADGATAFAQPVTQEPEAPAEAPDLDAPRRPGAAFESAETSVDLEPVVDHGATVDSRTAFEPVASPRAFDPDEAPAGLAAPPHPGAAFEPAETPAPDLGAPRRPGAAFEALSEPAPAPREPEPARSFDPFAGDTEATAFDPFAAVTPVDPEADAFHPPNGTPPKPATEPVVERPRSLFEPILEADDGPPLAEQKRPEPSPAQDQPFVPTFVPGPPLNLEESAPPESDLPQREVLPPQETPAGLPKRGARSSMPAHTPFQAMTPQPAQAPSAPVRPVRPRPVGFSPSTGGRDIGTTTTRYQQPEGFNPRSPFGPGSVLPRSDGLAPAADFEVKATLTGRRYFTPESANFNETRADVWFRTVADAQKAGFRPAP